MDSRTFTIQQIFQDRRQYRVPFYQRPYVWNRDDQWGRLWEDIRDKADTRLQGARPSRTSWARWCWSRRRRSDCSV